MKKFWMILAVVLVLATGVTVAFAATAAKTPAEIISGLTRKTETQVTEARQARKTYGAQAAEAGKLDEFKKERLAQYKLALDEAVKEKRITQAEADKLYDAMKARLDACTGNGTGRVNGGCGLGNGGMRGLGQGNGTGLGCGNRIGRGPGNGGCGNCTIPN